MPDRKQILEVAGHSVPVSHPDKVYFPQTGHTKLDVVQYYPVSYTHLTLPTTPYV